jgi:phosphatidylglycerophosphatase A
VSPEQKVHQDCGHRLRERVCAPGAGDGGNAGRHSLVSGLFSYVLPLWLITVAAFTCLAWYVSREAEKLFGQKDAQCIVIDEITGFQWTLFLIAPTALHVALGFILFRLFDIVKPFPARLFQKRLPGGYGVVGDDLAAAVYANLALQLLVRFRGI